MNKIGRDERQNWHRDATGAAPLCRNGRRWFSLALPLPMALLSAALAGCHSRPQLTPQQAEGQHLYAVRCAHCHDENDLALKPAPPNVHGAMEKAKLPSGAPATDAEVRRLVLTGKGKMPSFSGRFTEEQMAALLAYLRTDMPLPQNGGE